jgi:hypothetical protein
VGFGDVDHLIKGLMTICRVTFVVLAQPIARGAAGVGEVRHLWRAGTAHHSGEPREEDIVVSAIKPLSGF